MSTPALRFDVFTLFPRTVEAPLEESIIRRAIERGIVAVQAHDIRTWTHDRHRTADDTPYGGGAGMVMLAAPIVDGVEAVLGDELPAARVLVMTPAGRVFDQAMARDLARAQRVVVICGHYEGIDQRVIDVLGAEEVSIGDYVLTGGELAASVVIDAVARLVPGVIEEASISEESHSSGLVEYPQYTRPQQYRGLDVPGVLLSGHHAQIAAWRRAESIRKTAAMRPDLLAKSDLTERERAMLDELKTDA